MDLNNSSNPQSLIKPLKEPIEIILIQYECTTCKKKSYINKEDKKEDILKCLFCNGESKYRRIFDVNIKGIGEY